MNDDTVTEPGLPLDEIQTNPLVPAAASVLCPHYAHPLPDCFCRELNGENIPRVIAFCDGHYYLCPVYRRARPPRTRDDEGIETGD